MPDASDGGDAAVDRRDSSGGDRPDATDATDAPISDARPDVGSEAGPTDVPPPPPPNYMFVTSGTHQPPFGTLAAADNACNAAATAAGLPGTYRAWLSTSSVDAIDRIAGARGWIRPDGVPFADAPAHLYCFGVDRLAPLAPVRTDGKVAFLSDGYFVPGGGLQAADALCAAEAASGKLSGRFTALLGTSTAAASSRFPTFDSTTWVRPDGVRLNARGERLGSTPMLTALNVTSRQAYLWVGLTLIGPDLTNPLGASRSCGAWKEPGS